jgi:hypothetical protein
MDLKIQKELDYSHYKLLLIHNELKHYSLILHQQDHPNDTINMIKSFERLRNFYEDRVYDLENIVNKDNFEDLFSFDYDQHMYESYANRYGLLPDNNTQQYIKFYKKYIVQKFYNKYDKRYLADPALRAHNLTITCNAHYIREQLHAYTKRQPSANCAETCEGKLAEKCGCGACFLDFSFKHKDPLSRCDLGSIIDDFINIKVITHNGGKV